MVHKRRARRQLNLQQTLFLLDQEKFSILMTEEPLEQTIRDVVENLKTS